LRAGEALFEAHTQRVSGQEKQRCMRAKDEGKGDKVFFEMASEAF